MTQFTGFGGERMVQALTQANASAIVTAGLCTGLPHHRAMIKYGNQKTQGAVMTNITFRCGGHVSRMFAQGNAAVVTVAAYISGLIVCKGQHQR